MIRKILWVLVASVCVWSAGCTVNVNHSGKSDDAAKEKETSSNPDSPKPDSVAEPTDQATSTQSAKEKKPTQAQDDPEAVKSLESLGATLKKDKDGQTVEVSFRGTTVDESFLTALAKLPRLKSLVLTESGVTDENLKNIGSLKTLRNLDLRGCKTSNAGIAALSGLTDLQALRLNGKNGATTVDDTGLASVAQLTNLKVLLLDHLWIGDAGLKHLAPLKNLEELYLASTMTSDAGLEAI